MTSLWALYLLTLRQHRHGKRWIVMTVLMLLPAAMALLVRLSAQDVPSRGLEFIFIFMFIPQALLPLAALIYASGIIQDEQEEQTITYLLMRPISKWAIYLVKLAATLTTTVFIAVFFTCLTYAAVYAGAGKTGDNISVRCLTACGIHSLAIIAYCCIFGLMSLLTRRTLIVGILYIAIFEGLFANLPFGIRLITVIYYTRLVAYRTLSFIVPTPDGLQNIAADTWQLDIAHDPQLLQQPGIETCLLVLIGGSLLCALLASFLCWNHEFHVKTPERV